MNEKTFKYKEEIQKAFDGVKRVNVVNCVKRCAKLISNSESD